MDAATHPFGTIINGPKQFVIPVFSTGLLLGSGAVRQDVVGRSQGG